MIPYRIYGDLPNNLVTHNAAKTDFSPVQRSPDMHDQGQVWLASTEVLSSELYTVC